MVNLAETFLRLSRDDFSTLKGIEAGMRTHEWVPVNEIARITGLPIDKADYRLSRLSDMGLVARETIHYLGYRMDFDAYDILALQDFSEKNAVTCIGEKIGVGKESVVYEALGQIPLAIKFHREGRTSFKHVRRDREHLNDGSRCAWIHAARRSARHEFGIMQRLYPQVSIPRPVALSRHAIAMELICGPGLGRITLSNPEEALEIILGEVKTAYGLGIIHADLSEYNVIVLEDQIKIIDWPQAVPTDHPNAEELLERDVSNVLRFFDRKYKLKASLEDALAGIKGPAAPAAPAQEVE
ncbi:MAG TPA: RIO1 family regulatory kinase/ATPase [Methanotrichaceae archaeon]|nr:RIO1 family regulatory kinase/ATPase [Methanotrichaceae archaeon]